MHISLDTTNVINDIGARFLMETGAKSPTPPRGILLQSINEAKAVLDAAFARFYEPTFESDADDTLLGGANASIEFDFRLSRRRASGKSQALADSLHACMVSGALAKSLASMNQKELSADFEKQFSAEMQTVITLLTTKQPPLL